MALIEPAPAPASQPELAESTLPPAFTQLPAIGALFAGSPAALSLELTAMNTRPEGKLIAEAAPALVAAGIGFYRTQNGKEGVLFNQTVIHPDQIKAADKAGTLGELAPPFDDVNAAVGALKPEDHPLASAPPAAGFAPPPAPQVPSTAIPPATKPKAARVNALSPQSPTSGAKPGQGRLLNSILKPVV